MPLPALPACRDAAVKRREERKRKREAEKAEAEKAAASVPPGAQSGMLPCHTTACCNTCSCELPRAVSEPVSALPAPSALARPSCQAVCVRTCTAPVPAEAKKLKVEEGSGGEAAKAATPPKPAAGAGASAEKKKEPAAGDGRREEESSSSQKVVRVLSNEGLALAFRYLDRTGAGYIK